MGTRAAHQWSVKFRHSPYLLMGIMAVGTLIVVGVTIWLLYRAGYEQQRQRLIEMVSNQSGIIKMVAEHEFSHEQKNTKNDRMLRTAEETLKKVIMVHKDDAAMGNSGEFTLAKLENEQIVFLLNVLHPQEGFSGRVPMEGSSLAEPMRRALHGGSGTVVGEDYRGRTVLAAYQPVEWLEWGIVAKLDLSEIRRPYIMAGIYALLSAVFFIILGSTLFFRVLKPLFTTLEEGQRYNRMLFDHSPMGLALCRMDGQLVDVNPAFSKIIGYSVEETLRLSYWDITPKKYMDAEEKQLEILLDKHWYGPYEKEFYHKKGHLVPVSLCGRMLMIKGVPHIWSSTEDISLRKRNEEQLRQASNVFDNSQEGILITDRECNVVRVNRAFTKITGYTPAEVKGKNPRLLQSGRHDKAFYAHMWAEITSNGRWRGEVWNKRKDGRVFPALQSITTVFNDEGRVEGYVSVFSDIGEIKAYEEQLAHLANHDPLTGLPNRMMFETNLEQTLQRAKRNKGQFALLFLDMNRFKEVNDSLGHDAGDILLKTVAWRLKEGLRAEDMVARLGGDEFTVILPEVNGVDGATLVAQKLIEKIGEPLEMGESTLSPQVSVGISLYPDHHNEAEGLLKAADAAMYRAKEKEKSHWVLYEG